MGDNLTGPAAYNKKGVFEHYQFYGLNHAIASKVDNDGLWNYDTIDRFPHLCNLSIDELRIKYKAEAERLQRDFYGQKEPVLAVAWPYVHDLIPGDKRIIFVHRAWDSSMASALNVRQYINQKNMTLEHMESMYRFVLDACEAAAESSPFEVLHVDYELVLTDTVEQVRRILQFVENGTGTKLDERQSIKFVAPELNHHWETETV